MVICTTAYIAGADQRSVDCAARARSCFQPLVFYQYGRNDWRQAFSDTLKSGSSGMQLVHQYILVPQKLLMQRLTDAHKAVFQINAWAALYAEDSLYLYP